MVASKEDKSLLPTKVDLIEEVSSEVVIELMKEGLERLRHKEMRREIPTLTLNIQGKEKNGKIDSLIVNGLGNLKTSGTIKQLLLKARAQEGKGGSWVVR